MEFLLYFGILLGRTSGFSSGRGFNVPQYGQLHKLVGTYLVESNSSMYAKTSFIHDFKKGTAIRTPYTP